MKNSLRPTYFSYVVGFAVSIVLTLAAYFLTRHHLNTMHRSPSDHVMQFSLLSLAVIQLFAQLVFFLHLGRESKPRWRSMAFLFALIVVLIIVIGSIWIMDNLNYRMTKQQTQTYLKNQDGGI